jgi:hypothetical protein
MGFKFSQASELRGGSGRTFFKPAEYAKAVLIVFEPTGIRRKVKTVYEGEERLRDEADATITVFASKDALKKGKPSEVLENAVVTHARLVWKLERALDDDAAAVGRIVRDPEYKGKPYDLDDVDEGLVELAVAYFDGRETAQAEARASVPSFDD